VSNEAAERLLALYPPSLRPAMEDALAAERKATVERIRAALDADSFYGNFKQPRGRLNAILDAEALDSG
jgi:molybdopterin-guanine dinucleotide biosynthesis protein A